MPDVAQSCFLFFFFYYYYYLIVRRLVTPVRQWVFVIFSRCVFVSCSNVCAATSIHRPEDMADVYGIASETYICARIRPVKIRGKTAENATGEETTYRPVPFLVSGPFFVTTFALDVHVLLPLSVSKGSLRTHVFTCRSSWNISRCFYVRVSSRISAHLNFNRSQWLRRVRYFTDCSVTDFSLRFF